MSCSQVLVTPLKKLAESNARFPAFLFNDRHCEGTPADATLVEIYEQKWSGLELGLVTIGSLYLPPHLELQLFSNEGHTFSLLGPTTIQRTSALLSRWVDPLDPTQIETDRVSWRFGSKPHDIASIMLHVVVPWDTLIQRMAATKQNFAATPLNYEAYFKDYCSQNPSASQCNCVNVYQTVLNKYSPIQQHMYLNLLPGGCDPQTMYVPPAATIGQGTDAECLDMIRAQLKQGLLPSAAQGGPATIECNHQSYPNVDQESSAVQQRIETSLVSDPTLMVIITMAMVGSFALLTFWFFTLHLHIQRTSTSSRVMRRLQAQIRGIK